MSHSFKKTPVLQDRSWRSGSKKYWKRQASKKVRKSNRELGSKSNAYRKLYESWNISDYRFYTPETREMTEEEKSNWKKFFFRK